MLKANRLKFDFVQFIRSGFSLSAKGSSYSYQIGCDLFLRALSLCFGIAFVSLWLQLEGLYGAHGISPIRDLMFHGGLAAELHHYIRTPTIFWLNASDGFMHLICGLGVLLSIVTGLGWGRGPGLLLLWVGYLSFCTVGVPFLNFQWDSLLLEASLLGSLLICWRSWKPKNPLSHPLVRWLAVFLLFRLMWASGIVKLSSGDPTWSTLAALEFHFFTQPLPGALAWWLHQLPEPLLVLSTALMFVIELVIPFFFFLPRRWRLVGALATVLLQIAIILSGNYGFFNLLTIGLCLLLIDDNSWRKWTRGWLHVPDGTTPAHSISCWQLRVWHGGAVTMTLLVLFMSSVQWFGIFGRQAPLPQKLEPFYYTISSYRSINSYGLFATMTTRRLELTIEGSQNGTTWQPYTFHWKPNTVADGLPVVAPHMPRLDWQMWFAALTPPESNRNVWLQRLCTKIALGNQDVLELLKDNPFLDRPPRYIRIRATEFIFTSASERSESGELWKEERSVIYWPAIHMQQ